MTPTTQWTDKYYMGRVAGKRIYLSAPSWGCGWYWGFGYLGNNNCHYHLDGIDRTKNLYAALIEHFNEGFIFTVNIEESPYSNKLWVFCELVKTAYCLKETAEVLRRGGSHFTTNPCCELIKNEEEVKRINEVVLPAIFDKLDALLKEVTQQHKHAPKNKSLTSAAI